jgi:hypothetical protein
MLNRENVWINIFINSLQLSAPFKDDTDSAFGGRRNIEADFFRSFEKVVLLPSSGKLYYVRWKS